MNRIVTAAALIALTSACGSKQQRVSASGETELTAAEVSGSVPMRGRVRMSRDGAWFEECAGRVAAMPLARSGQSYSYLDDYFRTGSANPARGAIVTVRAHTERRSDTGRDELVIDQMDRIASGNHVTCSTIF
jgi:hypothetical protein